MENEHTPEPWKIEEDNLGCKNIVRQHDEEKGIFTVTNIGYTHGLEEGEDLANARLIAAAPDLLATCEIMKDKFIQDFDLETWLEHHPDTEAAIAKSKSIIE